MQLRRRTLIGWAGLSAAGAATGPFAAGPAAAGLPVRRSALVRVGVDGSIRWQTPVPLGPDEQGSDAVTARGRVFLAQDGTLRSYDVTSGAAGWARTLGGTAVQLLTVDGLVLVVVSSGPG